MTIEEKAKYYDESIERAKVFKEHLLEIDEKDYADEIDYIFPKLAESEDERIRKELIEYLVKDVGLYPGENRKEHKWLAWLEKQGNQKLNSCENCGIATHNCQKFPCTIRDGEQKSANWLQELEDKLANATPQQLAEWKEKYFKEEPAEWSEEDEKILSDIIKDLVHPWNEYIPDRIEDEIKWLKNRLKSLRPQNRWKPSDEQMDALYYVTNFDYGGHKAILVSLYEQLKKLM